jgi:hypothetical protein
MPYAPVPGLVALTLQPLSASHNGCRQENWLEDHPNEVSMALAVFCGELGIAGARVTVCWPAACWAAGRGAAASQAAAREAASLAAVLCWAASAATVCLAAAARCASSIAAA